jgi:putative hydrolase
VDVNAVVGGLLRDLAFVQQDRQKMFGYKRAAAVVLGLETSLADLVRPDRSLPKIAGIGPASTRVILEVLETGGSSSVDEAVARSDRAADVERRRALRSHFLSRAEVVRVLGEAALGGPRPDEYRGDLQMHSEWSDGAPTLGEIADACLARGYQYAAVTDHSHGLPIARGMSMDQARRQRTAITRLNREYAGRFRLLHGIEANIAADGSLDLSAEEASHFELVLAAPHSKLRRAEDQTPRLVTAVHNPAVHILAHPRGRISGTRAGIQADWDAVFVAAAEARVAIEIDGDPARQDLDFGLASRALAAGCVFALDSDAHATWQLAYAETALAHARLAGIPADRIVNCWPVDRLLQWLEEKSALQSGRAEPDASRATPAAGRSRPAASAPTRRRRAPPRARSRARASHPPSPRA